MKNDGVSLKEVILMFDPGFALNKCLTGDFGCFLGSRCPIHEILCKAQKDLFRKLDSISIKEVAKKGKGR